MANEIRYSSTMVRDSGLSPVVLETGVTYETQATDLRTQDTLSVAAGARIMIPYNSVTEAGLICLHNRSPTATMKISSAAVGDPFIRLLAGQHCMFWLADNTQLYVESNADGILFYNLLNR